MPGMLAGGLLLRGMQVYDSRLTDTSQVSGISVISFPTRKEKIHHGYYPPATHRETQASSLRKLVDRSAHGRVPSTDGRRVKANESSASCAPGADVGASRQRTRPGAGRLCRQVSFLALRPPRRAIRRFAPPICAEYDAMQRCCYRPLHFKGKGLRRSQEYCVLLESVRGRRSLHPNDEDLSVGTLVLAVAPTSGL
jgi:hypothetical protein